MDSRKPLIYKEICYHCHGSGIVEADGYSCPTCGGSGEVSAYMEEERPGVPVLTPPPDAALPGSEELAEALAEISAAGLGAVAEGLRLHISDLTRRQAKIEALESELRNIAYAKRSNFTDCYEFMLWAQSRAQHTLESTEVKP